ncbi:YicC/YloC family endoribonuclease [Alkalihalobacillus sp. 1P02AB]|uniref:YicC/YloC family endoribonuclease n=1 Tax=Alkalihalobacillus sp. 1P02AB TaxID=3132260 RepID=UPI0039A497C7
MVKSMTGYGQAVYSNEQFTVHVEIRTVNHRFFECSNIRLPRRFLFLEEIIRKEIKEKVQRGKVDVFIKVEGTELVSKKLVVDWTLLKQFKETAKEIKAFTEADSELNIQAIMDNEHLVEWVEQESDNPFVEEKIIQTVKEAISQLDKMRMREGLTIEHHFQELLTELLQSIHEVEQLAPEMGKIQQEKLLARLKEWVKEEQQLDEGRIVTEVGIIMDKCDITEELSRLHSHQQQFKGILQETIPIGRKLDFLAQEMNRETNTIGAKVTDLRIKQHVVVQKSIIEKLKEQVQNVE